MPSPVRAGKFNRRVTLQQPVFTRNRGAAITTFADVATVWAAIEPLRGKEFFESQKHTDQTTIRIRIRFRNDVRPTWRIKMSETATSPPGERLFRITGQINPFDGRQELQFMVQEFPSGEVV